MVVPIIKAPNLSCIPKLCHGFTTRIGGVSNHQYAFLNLGWTSGDDPHHVEMNYKRLTETLGISAHQLIRIQQVHGNEIVRVTHEQMVPEFRETQADGLITSEPGIFLSVRVADCYPILIVDSRIKAVGCVHAGWRGTLARIACGAVQKMKNDFGSQAQDLFVAIGPGIGIKHFQVSLDVVSMFESQLKLTTQEVIKQEGKGYLDLSKINSRLIAEEGVPKEHIWACSLCTYSHKEQLFSYRRDGELSGRMIGFIGWHS